MSETALPTINSQAVKKRPFLTDILYRLVREKPLGTVGGVITILFFLVGIFANFIAPHGMNDTFPNYVLKPPSAQFLLGTDNLGRDELSRIIYGARISMMVGLFGMTIATLSPPPSVRFAGSSGGLST